MTNSKVLPLFPTPVGVFKLSDEFDEDFADIIQNALFSEDNEKKKRRFSSSTGTSQFNVKVLEKYPKLTRSILSFFRAYVESVYEYSSKEFQLTSSWLTRTEEGQCSQIHSHVNSFFSGVLYLTDDPNQSPIRFHSPLRKLQALRVNPAAARNLWNSETWELNVNKNDLVFFPSFLEHEIDESKSTTTRYSLAFNFFPNGSFKQADSTVTISVL
jgi:uncharacterized protein (TIGR02466 family)